MVILRAVRGMNDMFEPELCKWRRIEAEMAKVFFIHGYKEIRTPLVEELALFERGVGEDTDIVEKEMFVLKEGEHEYCLRPENTASVVRALIERGGIDPDFSSKLYYVGPMFRKERPQRGRLRQFHQFGLECLGFNEPSADIEIMTVVSQLLKNLKIDNVSIKINTLGLASERKMFRDMLTKYLNDFSLDLCGDCQRRLKKNPLRVLDCKKEGCIHISSGSPKILDTLGDDSKKHFSEVLQGLSSEKLDFIVDHRLVRGLDYYEKTVFEFVASSGLGAQNSVAAGGRYGGLFKTLGHSSEIAAIGCAGGIERMVLLMSENYDDCKYPDVSLIGADDKGLELTLKLAFELRRLDVAADFCHAKKSVKALMRRADKLFARHVLVIGSNEIEKNTAILQDLRSKARVDVSLEAKAIANKLKESAII